MGGTWLLVIILIWSHPAIDTHLWFYSEAECQKAAEQIKADAKAVYDGQRGPSTTCVYHSR